LARVAGLSTNWVSHHNTAVLPSTAVRATGMDRQRRYSNNHLTWSRSARAGWVRRLAAENNASPVVASAANQSTWDRLARGDGHGLEPARF
jgi:hypothetical protein